MCRFGHNALRYYAVFLRDIIEQVPYAAVAYWALEEEFHVAVGHIAVGRSYDVLQEEIALFEHIPEIVVVMREVERGEVEFIHYHWPQYVHGGEHPASARLFLVGYAFDVYFVFEEVVYLAVEVVIQRQFG